MNLEKLLKDRVIQRITPNEDLAKKIFKLAQRDLKVAKSIFESEDFDWCLAISYNAMLQAGRSLMFLKGYKPSSQYKHVAVVQFVRAAYKGEFSNKLMDISDRTRKKRHRIVYEELGIVSEEEAEQAIKWAEEFVDETKRMLKL